MVEFFKWAGLTVGAAATLGVCIFVGRWVFGIFANYITFRLRREQQLEDREREERLKGELRNLTESLKSDLQRKLLVAELRVRSLHKVYPLLSKRFHDALGTANHAINPGDIGGPNYENLNEKELNALLDQYRLNERDRQELLNEISRRPRNVRQHFFKLERRKRFADAFNARARAHNYMLIKRLYLSDEVLQLARTIDQGLVSPLVDAQMFYEYGPAPNAPPKLNDAMAAMTGLGDVLELLDKQMRKELSPPEEKQEKPPG